MNDEETESTKMEEDLFSHVNNRRNCISEKRKTPQISLGTKSTTLRHVVPLKQGKEHDLTLHNNPDEDTSSGNFDCNQENSEDFSADGQKESTANDGQSANSSYKRYKSSDSPIKSSNVFATNILSSLPEVCKSNSSVQKKMISNEMITSSRAVADKELLKVGTVDASSPSTIMIRRSVTQVLDQSDCVNQMQSFTSDLFDDVLGMEIKEEKMDDEEISNKITTVNDINLSSSNQMQTNQKIKEELDDYLAAGPSGVNKLLMTSNTIISNKVVSIPATNTNKPRKIIVIKKPLSAGMPRPANSQIVRKISLADFEKLGANKSIKKITRNSSSTKVIATESPNGSGAENIRYNVNLVPQEPPTSSKANKMLTSANCRSSNGKTSSATFIGPTTLPKLKTGSTTVTFPKTNTKIFVNKQNTIYRCQKCHLLFTAHSEYIEHIKEHKSHIVFNEKRIIRLEDVQKMNQYQCTQCNAGFPTLEKLSMHENRHKTELRQEQVMKTNDIQCEAHKKDEENMNLNLNPAKRLNDNHLAAELIGSLPKGVTVSKITHRDHKVVLNTPISSDLQISNISCAKLLGSSSSSSVNKSTVVTFPKTTTKVDFSEQNTIYKCKVCDLLFTCHSDFIQHKREHKQAVQRSDAAKSIQNKATSKRGRKSKPKQIFSCEACNKQCATNAALRKHILIHHTNRPSFKCVICDAESAHLKSLERHVRNKHSNSKRNTYYQCDQCLISFRGQKLLHEHKIKEH